MKNMVSCDAASKATVHGQLGAAAQGEIPPKQVRPAGTCQSHTSIIKRVTFPDMFLGEPVALQHARAHRCP